MTSAALFEPLQLAAGLTLKNRIVMASLTRGRSSYTVPNDINVEYYKQRSSAGLIISEGERQLEGSLLFYMYNS